ALSILCAIVAMASAIIWLCMMIRDAVRAKARCAVLVRVGKIVRAPCPRGDDAAAILPALRLLRVKWNHRNANSVCTLSRLRGRGGEGARISLYLFACPLPIPPAEVGSIRLRPA